MSYGLATFDSGGLSQLGADDSMWLLRHSFTLTAAGNADSSGTVSLPGISGFNSKILMSPLSEPKQLVFWANIDGAGNPVPGTGYWTGLRHAIMPKVYTSGDTLYWNWSLYRAFMQYYTPAEQAWIKQNWIIPYCVDLSISVLIN
jgi:hypothetical protein